MMRSRRVDTARHDRRRGVAWARAAMAAGTAVLAAMGLVACGQRAVHVASGTAAAVDPRLAAIVGSPSNGSSSQIELISPESGRAAKIVAGGTSNGLALSPDSKDLYVVRAAGRAIEIQRISIATGKTSVVAHGVSPAISPDGRYLAYATGGRFTKVAVRNLSTGRVRMIELRSLLGSDGSLLNQGQVTWLGNGNELIVVPGISASEAAARIPATAGATESEQFPPGRQTLIVVRISQDGLAARRIIVADPYQEPFQLVSGDMSQKRAALIAWVGYAGAGTITRVSLHGNGYHARVVAKLPRGAMPVTIAPYGDRVLYLIGHTPTELWVAAIESGRLTDKHLLHTDTSRFGVDQAAW